MANTRSVSSFRPFMSWKSVFSSQSFRFYEMTAKQGTIHSLQYAFLRTSSREATNLLATASGIHHEDLWREHKRGKKLTPHPSWVLDLRRQIEPTWNAILNCRLIREASAGTLSLPQMRGWLLQLYPFIETFPKWIALSIPKTQDPMSRNYLIDN